MHRSIAAGVALGLLCAAPVARAVTYTDLYTLGLPPGFPSGLILSRNDAAAGQVTGYASASNGRDHAVLWTPAAPGGTDLHPDASYFNSHLYSTDGVRQAGDTQLNGVTRAAYWSGTAASFVDLHPASGYTGSSATAVNGTFQVGSGTLTGGSNHALLWSGSAGSVVDLHPATGFASTFAQGVGGGQQVGRGFLSGGGAQQALLWTGSAASLVNLTPTTAGSGSSGAVATDGLQQVGSVTRFNALHAALWTGTAASFVDLNPGSFAYSQANDVSAGRQVGYAVDASGMTSVNHAFLWTGTAASGVDLQAVLPATFVSSIAYGIVGDTVYGVANDAAGNAHAIAWNLTAVPEPAGVAALAVGGGLLRRRRRGTGR